MSKAIENFVQKAKALSGAPSKFTRAVADGNRILPSRSKDADFQCRIDAGRYDPGTQKLNVVLQINSQAKSPALKDWARKKSTHDKLATEVFDTNAKDKNVELDRVLASLEAQAKSKLG